MMCIAFNQVQIDFFMHCKLHPLRFSFMSRIFFLSVPFVGTNWLQCSIRFYGDAFDERVYSPCRVKFNLTFFFVASTLHFCCRDCRSQSDDCWNERTYIFLLLPLFSHRFHIFCSALFFPSVLLLDLIILVKNYWNCSHKVMNAVTFSMNKLPESFLSLWHTHTHKHTNAA